MIDPYTTPESKLETNSGSRPYLNLPRFSCWGVLGLSIVTLGIYFMYWLYSRTQILNPIAVKPIPRWVIFSAIIGYIIYTPISWVTDIIPSNLQLILMAASFLFYIFFYYWWVFAFKNQLKFLSAGSTIKFGPFLTFLLQAIYLQYKINQLHDQEN